MMLLRSCCSALFSAGVHAEGALRAVQLFSYVLVETVIGMSVCAKNDGGGVTEGARIQIFPQLTISLFEIKVF